MTVFTYIGENIDRYKMDIRIGLMSYCVIKYWYIYSRYLYYKSINYGTMDAVMCTSEDFRIGERMIFKIIRKMEAEV